MLDAKTNSASAPPADSWLKRRDESAKAYDAFKLYRDSVPKRSLREVSSELGKQLSQIGDWSGKYDWVARKVEYDARQEQIHLEEAERLAKMDDAKWAQRALDQREEKYQVGGELIETGKKMIKLPFADQKSVQRYEDGRERTIQLKCAGWAQRVAVRLLEAGLALRDQAIRNEGAVDTHTLGADVWDEIVPLESLNKT